MALNFNQPSSTINNGVSTMNLAKTVVAGERINLAKEQGENVTKYAMGLMWNQKPGIVVDCDLSIVLLDVNDNVVPGSNGPNMPKCLVYYGQKEVPGVKSYGDNRTGDNSEFSTPTGSDEQIDVDLAQLEPNVNAVMIVATTHSEVNGAPGTPIPFGRAAKPVLTIYKNMSVPAEPLYKFELDEDFSAATSVEVAKFYKKDGQWRYVSMADQVGTHAFGLQGIIDKFGIK